MVVNSLEYIKKYKLKDTLHDIKYSETILDIAKIAMPSKVVPKNNGDIYELYTTSFHDYLHHLPASYITDRESGTNQWNYRSGFNRDMIEIKRLRNRCRRPARLIRGERIHYKSRFRRVVWEVNKRRLYGR